MSKPRFIMQNCTRLGASMDYTPSFQAFLGTASMLNNEAFAFSALGLVIEKEDSTPEDQLDWVERLAASLNRTAEDMFGVAGTATPVGIYGPVLDEETGEDVHVALLYVLTPMRRDTEDADAEVKHSGQVLVEIASTLLEDEGEEIRFVGTAVDLYQALDLIEEGNILGPSALERPADDFPTDEELETLPPKIREALRVEEEPSAVATQGDFGTVDTGASSQPTEAAAPIGGPSVTESPCQCGQPEAMPEKAARVLGMLLALLAVHQAKRSNEARTNAA